MSPERDNDVDWRPMLGGGFEAEHPKFNTYRLVRVGGERVECGWREHWPQHADWRVTFQRQALPPLNGSSAASSVHIQRSYATPEAFDIEQAQAWALEVVDDDHHAANPPEGSSWSQVSPMGFQIEQPNGVSYTLEAFPELRAKVGESEAWSQQAMWYLYFTRLRQERRRGEGPFPIVIELHCATLDDLDEGAAQGWALGEIAGRGFGA